MFVQEERAITGFFRMPGMYRLVLLCALLLAAGPSLAAHARLNMQVNRDRITLAVTHYPQVYLYGEIDADAPQRFATLVASGKVPAGSDIYLNVTGGDLKAGMALGRIFRAQGMATHLGARRQPKGASLAARTAMCVDACTYAFFGGRYRWTPSGNDRIGLTAAAAGGGAGSSQTTPEVAAYLKSMGINLDALGPSAHADKDGVVWLKADTMIAAGLANNGRLAPTATYDLTPPGPTLELRQIDRQGEHRLKVQCEPGKTTVTGYDPIGVQRAREIVARNAHSYLELNGQDKVLEQTGNGAAVEGNALVITRSYPPADLVDLVSARSVGAWVTGRSEAFRDGFSIQLEPVRKQLRVYYYSCWRAAPWPARQKKS